MLRVEGLSAGYNQLPVLRDVNISVPGGEILLVLGPNGAGKSTLLKAIAGFLPPQAGSVILGGVDITGWSAQRVARSGLRLVLEGHRTFPELSVEDNLRLGGQGVARNAVMRRVLEVYDFFEALGRLRKVPASQLSGGQQQMLVLGQAFVARPKVLLCDEPSLGLSAVLLPPIWHFLRARAEEGTAVVVVEQMIDENLRVADSAIVLDQGAVALCGTANEVLAGDQLRKIYLGGLEV